MRIGSINHRQQENWLFRAFGIFIVGLTLWILVALTLSSANAGTFSLLADLSSKLKASYGIDLFGNSMGSLQLSIIEDAWRDSGGSPFGEDDPGEIVAQFIGSPVPTATLTGDERVGEPTQPPTPIPDSSETPSPTPSPTFTPTASPTATSSPTSTATEVSDSSGGNDGPTETPSATPSKTPRPSKTPTSTATKTPYPSKTPTPTATKTPKPSKTPTPTDPPPTDPPPTDPPPTYTPSPTDDGIPSGPSTPAAFSFTGETSC